MQLPPVLGVVLVLGVVEPVVPELVVVVVVDEVVVVTEVAPVLPPPQE